MSHDDPEGTALPNKEAALAYAGRIMRELKEAGGYDDPGLMMIVKDSAGETIFSVPFQRYRRCRSAVPAGRSPISHRFHPAGAGRGF